MLSCTGEEAGFGLESLLEVLGFVVDTLATPQGTGGHSDLHIFGLELMHAAIQAGGAGACRWRLRKQGRPDERCAGTECTAVSADCLRLSVAALHHRHW